MQQARRVLVGLLWASCLAACGGGGDGSTTVDATPEPPPTAPAVVARVEIADAAPLLAPGASVRLSARAYDANGTQIPAVFRWTASNAIASVDADGTVTAGAAVGSVRLTASADGVRSTPVIGLVARLTAGTRLLSDAEVLSTPAIDGTPSLDLIGTRLRVLLAGAPPAPGQLLIGNGRRALAGRVVSSTPSGVAHEVLYEVVPLDALFAEFKLDEAFDPADLIVDYPNGAPVATRTLADGTIEQDFVVDVPASKQTIAAATTKPRRDQPAAFKKNFQLRPFECESKMKFFEFDASQLHITVRRSLKPVFLTLNKSGQPLDLFIATNGGIGVHAEGPIRIRGKIDEKVECKAALVRLTWPVPPALALVILPQTPIGLRFQVDVAALAPAIELKPTIDVTQKFEFAYRIRDGVVTDLSPVDGLLPTFSGDFDMTADAADDIGFAAEVQVGGFADLTVTNLVALGAAAVLDVDPDLTIVEGSAGLYLSGKYERVKAQLARPGPDDRSAYEAGLKGSLGLSDDVYDLTAWLGLAKLVGAKLPDLEAKKTAAVSPQGLARARLSSFENGDALGFRIDLDPDKTSFNWSSVGALFYNIDKVQVWRREADDSATLLVEQAASPGQKQFTLDWTADRVDRTTGRYYAMVVPRFLPITPLLISETVGWSGARQCCGPGADGPGGVAVDDVTGDVFVAAYTRDHLSVDGKPLPERGGDDAIVTRYDAYGGITGVLRFGSPGNDRPRTLRMRDGYLYLAGLTTGSKGPFETLPPTASTNSGFMAKIDPRTLTFVWLRQFGDDSESVYSFDFAPQDGSLYVAREMSPDGVVVSSVCPDATDDGARDCGDVVLTKLDDTGNVLWSRRSVVPGWQFAPRVAVDPGSGNVWVSATTKCEAAPRTDSSGTPVDSDGRHVLLDRRCVPNQEHTASGDVLHQMGGLWRWSADGVGGPVGTVRIGDLAHSPHDVVLSALVVGNDGNLMSAGLTDGSLGGDANAGGQDVHLTSFDPDGHVLASRLLGTQADENINMNALIRTSGGWLMAFNTPGNYGQPSAGGNDIVLMSLDDQGGRRWMQSFGSALDDFAHAVAVDAASNVYVIGTTNGTLPGAASGGGTDVFLSKFGHGGRPQRYRGPGPAVKTALP